MPPGSAGSIILWTVRAELHRAALATPGPALDDDIPDSELML